MVQYFPMDIELHSGFQVATYPAGATFGPRRLRDWEMVWLIEGDAVYGWNDQTFDAPQGTLVLCRPEAIDSFRWDPVRPTRHAYFHFLLNGPLPPEWPPIDDWPLTRPLAGSGDLLRPLFQHLLAWNQQGDPTQTRLLALSLLAAYVTGQAVSTEVPRSALPETVSRVLTHIAQRLDAEPAARISLDDLAEVGYVTPEYLCHLFRSTTGRSPAETVRLARLDRALTLLARTNYSIGEIATLCGFESPFHFSRRFSEVYGRSPRTMRQAIAEGAVTPMTYLLPTSKAVSKP